MPRTHSERVQSTAAIAGHPLHPMLIPFPIAFLMGALATDLVYAFWQTADNFWARASLWLLGAGLVTGLLAAVLGLIDFTTIQRARQHRAGWIHAIGNATAMALVAANLALRLTTDPMDAVMPWGLVLSAVVAAILAVTGWFGGELAYRHKIGMAGHEETRRHVESPRREDAGNGQRRQPATSSNRKRRK